MLVSCPFSDYRQIEWTKGLNIFSLDGYGWQKLERMVQKFFQKSTVLIDGQFVQRRSKVRSSQNTFCMQPPCLNSPVRYIFENCGTIRLTLLEFTATRRSAKQTD